MTAFASSWRLITLALLSLQALSAPAVPSFEVKLGLNNVLTSGSPTTDVKSTFNLGAPEPRSYGYYDTDAQDLASEGWNVRLRHKEGSKFELVYKKRFDVNNGLDSALKTAEGAGFAKSDDNYEAQVDWTFTKQTLSFQVEKKVDQGSFTGTSMPSDKEGLDWVVDQIPGKLEKWKNGWGLKTLKASRLHGPVSSEVYVGSWEGVEVKVETLVVRTEDGSGTETLVELSFEADEETEAGQLREKAKALLKQKGWLVEKDMLKTGIVLDRY